MPVFKREDYFLSFGQKSKQNNEKCELRLPFREDFYRNHIR